MNVNPPAPPPQKKKGTTISRTVQKRFTHKNLHYDSEQPPKKAQRGSRF